MKKQDLNALVARALAEDIPKGDITTDPLLDKKRRGKAILLAKQDLILSGADPFGAVFKKLDSKAKVKWNFKNGMPIPQDSTICTISGNMAAILKAERTALNFLGHLSGIATLTARFVEKTAGTPCKILDTRKTTPGLRHLEKQAVADGGGTNHRLGLSDAILIKENHIRAAGSISVAIERLRKKYPRKPIEIEVTNESEIVEALRSHADKLLLDNMSLEEMDHALRTVNGRCPVEASGNMTLDRIADVAKLGVDFISVGQLTHSAPCVDVSLLLRWDNE